MKAHTRNASHEAQQIRSGYLVTALAAALFASCDGGEAGEGTLGLEIWGEEYIETGIPAEEFADGWSVTYDRFLVNVGDISVAREGEEPAIVEAGYRIHDLTLCDGPLEIVSVEAPAGTYGHTAYTIEPASADSANAGAVLEDFEEMVAGGFSVLVSGSATDGADSIEFAWGFTTATVYDPCHSTGALEDGGAVNVQITIHGDHLFYDDAVSDDPVLRFADIAAADADDDGEVTRAELEAYEITALPNYGVGSLDIDDMWGFIEHMTTTLGHIDGEGHCGQ